ncbi:MAG: 5'/3'-nucleotidase SurE [Syntrophobacterales bacterium]|nr:MAG: 5'/3'-nucleotidase SurE [Syntrophobacterales bacterium]
MTILVTNDDGIDSQGIQILAETLKALGRVYVVAPDKESSAMAHSLSLHRPLRVERVREDYFAVDGTPADCVNLAVCCLLPERPNLIASGINKGGNLGEDITYSGTVSAAFEGAFYGIPSFAISLVSKDDFKFKTAASIALRVARHVLKNGLPKDTFLNINVPNLDEDGVKSHRITRQGRRIYGDAVVEEVNPIGQKYYWIRGHRGFELMEGTDFEAISNHHISITPLHLDLTDYSSFEEMRKWKL